MTSNSETIVRQTLVFLKPMSLLPTIIGWIILLVPPFMHRALPSDWTRDLFPWVGIPAEPKIVFLLGYAAMFGAVVVLFAVAIFLAKNIKHAVMGKTVIGSIVIFIAIGTCGAAGLQMIEISQKMLAALFLMLPVLWLASRLVVKR